MLYMGTCRFNSQKDFNKKRVKASDIYILLYSKWHDNGHQKIPFYFPSNHQNYQAAIPCFMRKQSIIIIN